ERFFDFIDPDLRPTPANIHFPSTENIERYSDRIAESGGADVCYGGIGWSGHIAFWEPQLGSEFDGMESYRAAGARIVELQPMTSRWTWHDHQDSPQRAPQPLMSAADPTSPAHVGSKADASGSDVVGEIDRPAPDRKGFRCPSSERDQPSCWPPAWPEPRPLS